MGYYVMTTIKQRLKNEMQNYVFEGVFVLGINSEFKIKRLDLYMNPLKTFKVDEKEFNSYSLEHIIGKLANNSTVFFDFYNNVKITEKTKELLKEKNITLKEIPTYKNLYLKLLALKASNSYIRSKFGKIFEKQLVALTNNKELPYISTMDMVESINYIRNSVEANSNSKFNSNYLLKEANKLRYNICSLDSPTLKSKMRPYGYLEKMYDFIKAVLVSSENKKIIYTRESFDLKMKQHYTKYSFSNLESKDIYTNFYLKLNKYVKNGTILSLNDFSAELSKIPYYSKELVEMHKLLIAFFIIIKTHNGDRVKFKENKYLVNKDSNKQKLKKEYIEKKVEKYYREEHLSNNIKNYYDFVGLEDKSKEVLTTLDKLIAKGLLVQKVPNVSQSTSEPLHAQLNKERKEYAYNIYMQLIDESNQITKEELLNKITDLNWVVKYTKDYMKFAVIRVIVDIHEFHQIKSKSSDILKPLNEPMLVVFDAHLEDDNYTFKLELKSSSGKSISTITNAPNISLNTLNALLNNSLNKYINKLIPDNSKLEYNSSSELVLYVINKMTKTFEKKNITTIAR